jgi:hypothetical protein
MSSNDGRYASGEFSEELCEATNALEIVLLTVSLDSVASSQGVKIKLLYMYIQSRDI